jgi:hypothetical protein
MSAATLSHAENQGEARRREKLLGVGIGRVMRVGESRLRTKKQERETGSLAPGPNHGILSPK